MKKIDVLLVARPDHSMQIYNALLNQSNINFLFLSYKIFPQWLKKLLGIKKMTTVSRNAICSWKFTFLYLCKYKFCFSFSRNWDEKHVFDAPLKSIFKNRDIKIIHYWPECGDYEITKYVKKHPGTIAFADIHMPHPKAVYDVMKPIYERHGINPESTILFMLVNIQNDLAQNATDILAPSSYVVDTYRQIYTDKRYHVVSFGITISPSYVKRQRMVIKEFVYAGRISLEKGSDLLLEYFEKHPELTIHLYGGIISGQETVFNKYKNISNILFHGPVPKVELQERMKDYDVGIHLSRFDAYSLAVGEMIGAGLPVIVSTFTGNASEIENNNWGIVTPLDMNKIDSAIKTICTPEYYNQCADSIDVYIREKHKSYGEKMIDFYSRLCINS